ncbi:IS66 family insertion sequence element accessory protein TnpB [Poseidonocella sp. HB161398]|uniref:IS66 family insertion sequence element accessory protein TnpB n=1 Tax=Poseidonocella sp. HB161398 TaxID=2320855 RepID=UPI003510EAEC
MRQERAEPQGLCLYYKVLERGKFPWPSAGSGAARLTSAQLAMLWEGIDWRRPDWGAPPARAGWNISLISLVFMALRTLPW